MYWVASTVSPTFLCFYVDHACLLIEYCWPLALTSLHGMSIISVKLQSFHGEEVQTKLLRMFLLKFTKWVAWTVSLLRNIHLFYCLINLDQFVTCYSSGTTIIELNP